MSWDVHVGARTDERRIKYSETWHSLLWYVFFHECTGPAVKDVSYHSLLPSDSAVVRCGLAACLIRPPQRVARGKRAHKSRDTTYRKRQA